MPYELPFKLGETFYYHHGLFLGGELVIHYSGMAGPESTGKVEIVPIDAFGDQAQIELVFHPSRKFSPEVVNSSCAKSSG